MSYTVEIRRIPAQPIAIVRGLVTANNLPKRIRALFDEFYASHKGEKGLNIVYYPNWSETKEFEIECGVQVTDGGNSSTPAGEVATVAYFGPYEGMKAGHAAVHEWVQQNGKRIAGPSWEVYGHWTDDASKLRTDIFYLLAAPR